MSSIQQESAHEQESAHVRGKATIFPLDRFNAFSDGIFSIAITLLVLDLPVPPASVPLLPALREDWPAFLGYLISFAYIGGVWLAHSSLTKYVKRGDTVVYSINLLLLLFVALLPFTTRLMVTHLTGPDVEIAVVIYGINVLIASLTLSFLMLYIAREPSLLIDDIADDTVKRMYRQRWIAIGVAALGVALAFVAPGVAIGLYLVETALLLAFPLLSLSWHRLKTRQNN